MRRLWIVVLVVAEAAAQNGLSLREAVGEALEMHPLLAAEEARIESARGLRTQAGLRPNPRFVFQAENLRGGEFSFSREADTYAYLTQPLELFGKRERRVDAALAAVRRAELERELLRSHIAGRVKRTYWMAAGAQRLYELLLETGRNFQQVIEYHELRVREGAMAEADLLRVRVEGERLAITANSAALEAERARIQLLREMGRTEFPAVPLADPLREAGDDLPVADVARALEERPEMKIARQALEQARAEARLAQANWKPDFELLAGYKRAAGFNTVIGGLQIGLPLANRNQGTVAAATAQAKAAESSLAATEALVKAEVKAAVTECELRRKQLAESLRPLREHAAESARIALAAYREGGADLLRLLDAERLRLEVEMLHYRTLAEYWQSVAALETALGVMP